MAPTATAEETAELYERMRVRGGWLVVWKVTLRNRASLSAPRVCGSPAVSPDTPCPERDAYYEVFYNRGSVAEAQPSGEIVPWSWRISEEPDVGRIAPFAVEVGIHAYLGLAELARIAPSHRRIRVRAHHADLIGAGRGWAAFVRVQVLD